MLDNTMLCRSRGKQFTKFLLIHYRDDRPELILLHVKAFHLRLPLEDGRKILTRCANATRSSKAGVSSH